jgi:hypothetical protein
MTTATMTQTRTDVDGRTHPVAFEPCESCGCPFAYATDEVGIIWEPGEEISMVCLDEMCECHVSPVRGLRFLTYVQRAAS